MDNERKPPHAASGSMTRLYNSMSTWLRSILSEVATECNPMDLFNNSAIADTKLRDIIHVPYLPTMHQPGWALRYIVGPYNAEWGEMLLADVQAGLTVLMTLIPQGLSQATLANLPPIYGLYCSLIPTATYSFFGSSMILHVGPTALISLLTGSILTKYHVDFEKDLDMAVDTAAQAAFCCGVTIVILGLLNLGHLINFMSHPVMAGFTTGAAFIIGVTQLKSALGVSAAVPQVGGLYEGEEVESYYEVHHWWIENFNGKDGDGNLYRNFYAVKICFGIYVPLMIVQLIKWHWKPSAATKKSVAFKLWTFFNTILPLVAIIISARIAYEIKVKQGEPDDHYRDLLKVVGILPKGLNVFRIPKFRHPMLPFFADVVPLTLLSFMESYSIARNTAAQTNTLSTLSASQEMFANGVANLAACVSSGYPAAGSFSRSALNASVGARTQLSMYVTTIGIVIVLSALTEALQFIPSAALSAIIFVAIANLIHFRDFWHAWKYSKKDFFTMTITFIFVFVYETSIGLAVGLGTSVLVYCVFDIVLAKSHKPRLFTSARDEGGIDVVRIESDLNFLNAARIKDFILALVMEVPRKPPVNSPAEFLRFKVSNTLDSILKPNLLAGVDHLPKAIVIDMCVVKTADISGLESLEGAMDDVRKKGVMVKLINLSPDLSEYFHRFGIHSDKSTEEVNFEEYEKHYRIDLWTIQSKPLRNRTRTHSYEVAGMNDDVSLIPEDASKFAEVEMVTVGEVSESIAITIAAEESKEVRL